MRQHLTAAFAFRSAARQDLDILFALHLPPQRRQVRRSVKPLCVPPEPAPS